MGLNSVHYALNDGEHVLGLQEIINSSYYWAVPCIQYGDTWSTVEKMKSGFHGSFTAIHFVHDQKEYIGFMYLRSNDSETSPNYIYCTAFSREMVEDSILEIKMPSPMGQGLWTQIPSGSEEEAKDVDGFTNPNLHRRLDSDTNGVTYSVGIYGTNSYRYVYIPEHDEESTTSEIP